METRKICVATYSLTKGNGVDVSVVEFAKELAKYYDVKLAVIRSDIQVKDVEMLRYNLRGPGKMLHAARDIERQKFDIISTHIFPMDIVASMTKIPHLLHDPGVIQANLVSSMPELYNWSTVNLSRLITARKIALALPLSNYLAAEFRRKYFYRGRMEVLPYGIIFPKNEPEYMENKYGRYVLYVGVHRPYKGVHDLIDIFADVKKEVGDDVHLVTIGKSDNQAYYDRLRARAKEVGNVHMLGYVQDVWPYYVNASVYANCSRWEGEDRPVIEAQYMGKPAVTFNNCSHPEVVFYGSLANNKEEFKEALIKHLSDNKNDFSVRRKIIESFSTDSMVRNFIKITGDIGQE